MDVTVKEEAACEREVTIRVASSRVEQLMDQELGRLAGSVRLPGFRPGKIPRKLLESRFRERLASLVSEQLIQESYPKALADNGLRPVLDEPDLTLGQVARGEDFVYTARIQVYPVVEPQGYTELTLTRPVVQVTEADVDGIVEQLCTRHAHYEAEAEREAVLGDQVVLDYAGRVDDVLFPGGQAEGHVLDLGSGRFIAGFEAQLLGCKAGDAREVQVRFPDEYHAMELAGKEATFACTIQEVRQRILPPADDTLAEKLGVEGGLTALRADIQKALENQVATEVKKRIKQSVFDQLLESNPMEALPSQLLDRQRRAMVAHTKSEYQRQGLDPDALGIADATLEARFEEPAKTQVSLGLLMGAIAKKERLRVDEHALDALLDKTVSAYGEQAERMKKWFREDENRMADLRFSALEEQTVDWIEARSQVVDQEMTFQELTGKTMPDEG